MDMKEYKNNVKLTQKVAVKSTYWYKNIPLTKPAKLIETVHNIRKRCYCNYPLVRPENTSNEEVLLYLYSASKYQGQPGLDSILNETSIELYRWLAKRFIGKCGCDCSELLKEDIPDQLSENAAKLLRSLKNEIQDHTQKAIDECFSHPQQ